jgi:hypothetical protein
MQKSKTIPQGSLSFGQASLAASVILVLLAITVPVVGILMIPVVVITTVARAVRGGAPRPELLKRGWLTSPRSVPARVAMSRS